LRLPPPVSDELGATSPQSWNARPAERHSSVANRSRPLALIEGAGFERARKLDGDDDAIRRRRNRDHARALRQERRDIGRRRASLGLENAIADDAKHRGDGEQRGRARDRPSAALWLKAA
jgi:hypothetical protein